MKTIISFVMLLLATYCLTAQNNVKKNNYLLCDPEMVQSMFEEMGKSVTYLKDFQIIQDKISYDSCKVQKFTMVLSKNTIFRLGLKAAANFNNAVFLVLEDLDGEAVSPVINSEPGILVQYDITVLKSAPYSLKIFFRSGDIGCASVIISYVKAIGNINSSEPVNNIDKSLPLFNASNAEESFAKFDTFVKDELNQDKFQPRMGITIFVQFEIDEKGKVKNVSALNKKNTELCAKALQIIQSSPNWVPANYKGKAVMSNPLIVRVEF